MPESWRKAGGFRPDLLKAIKELRPPVIRWPGGCFASPYRWKDGVGPQHKRGPHPRTMWDYKEVNSLGFVKEYYEDGQHKSKILFFILFD